MMGEMGIGGSCCALAAARTPAASGSVVERDGIVVIAARENWFGDAIDADDDENSHEKDDFNRMAIEWC
jgi:hypothetical protein